MSLPSKREFLSQHTNPATGEPYAKFPSRGKFSTAALAFADEHKDEWSEDAVVVKVATAPVAPRPTVSTTPAPARVKVDTSQVDPKEVREWAAANGHKVSDRGRLPHAVVAAFLKVDGGNTGERAKPVRVAVAPVPKVRRETSGFTVVGGTLIRQDRCGKCPQAVSHCSCEGGPQAYGWLSKEHGSPLALTLDKPLV